MSALVAGLVRRDAELVGVIHRRALTAQLFASHIRALLSWIHF